MDNVRILKGYSKTERKELKKVKEILDINDLLHIITSFPSGTRFNLIWEKYDKADTDERISIIRDILDLYTGNAKFVNPKKYYVHLIKDDECSYLNTTLNNGHGVAKLGNDFASHGWKTKFTRDEVVAIDPKFVPFMEEIK